MIEKLKRTMYWSAFEDLFEAGDGVTRRVVPGRKDNRNPVFTAEMPWEGKSISYPTVLRDPETNRWQMWYRASGFVCYAESADGAHWERPHIGRVSFQGSTANNIVFDPRAHFADCDGGCVLRDDSDDPAERYKMCLAEGGRNRTSGGIHLLISPNGLDWTVKKAPIIQIHNDSQTPFLRDPVTGEYLIFHRPNFIVRSLAVSRSKDCLEWRGHNHFIKPDAHDDILHLEPYAIAVFPYDGHFLGFLKMYARQWYDRRCWIELVVCRDDWETGHGAYARAERWQRLSDRAPVVALGNTDDWDNFRMAPGHGLVPDGDGHWFYYHCVNALHVASSNASPHTQSSVGRAYFPKRGFFEWYADAGVSWLRTKPLFFSGDTLTLDYNAGDGTVRAGVLLPDGRQPDGFTPADCQPLTGASHDGKIAFKGGSLKQFADRPVHLVFHLQHGGRLFAFGVL